MKHFVLTLLFISTIFAQDIVSIVTSGDGPTKDQATTAALRNAIEQAYGAFISSNTKFLNDELIQDEIVSVSQGNIQDYSIISTLETKNGYNVTTKATVSLGKLTSFVQSKGGKTELAGALFARNIKILNFNQKNEQKALKHMYEAVLQMAKSGFYDFSIAAEEPKETSPGYYSIKLAAEVIPNQNYYSAMDYIRKTLESVSLSESEARNYDKINRRYQWFAMFYLVEEKKSRRSKKLTKIEKMKTIILRDADSAVSMIWLLYTIEIFHNEALKFTIKNGITTPYNNYIPGNIVWNNVNKQQNGWDYESNNKSYGNIKTNNFPWSIARVENHLSMTNIPIINCMPNNTLFTQDLREAGKGIKCVGFGQHIHTFKYNHTINWYSEIWPYYFAASFLIDHSYDYRYQTVSPLYLTNFNKFYISYGWNGSGQSLISNSNPYYYERDARSLKDPDYRDTKIDFAQLHLPPHKVQNKNPKVTFVIQNDLTLEQLEKISGYTIHSYYE